MLTKLISVGSTSATRPTASSSIPWEGFHSSTSATGPAASSAIYLDGCHPFTSTTEPAYTSSCTWEGCSLASISSHSERMSYIPLHKRLSCHPLARNSFSSHQNRLFSQVHQPMLRMSFCLPITGQGVSFSSPWKKCHPGPSKTGRQPCQSSTGKGVFDNKAH